MNELISNFHGKDIQILRHLDVRRSNYERLMKLEIAYDFLFAHPKVGVVVSESKTKECHMESINLNFSNKKRHYQLQSFLYWLGSIEVGSLAFKMFIPKNDRKNIPRVKKSQLF